MKISLFKVDTIFLFYITLIVLLSYKGAPTEIGYLVIILMVLTLLPIYMIKEKITVLKPVYSSDKIQQTFVKALYLSWIFIFLSWLTGVFIGIINNTPLEYVFRNFFGLNLYLLLPFFFIVKPKVTTLIKIVILFGLIQSFYIGFYMYDKILNPEKFFIDESLSDARTVYSSAFVVFFPLLALSFAKYYYGKRIYNYYNSLNLDSIFLSKYFIFIYIILLIIPAMSKGFILGVVILLFIIITSNIYLVKIRTLSKPFVKTMICIFLFFGYIFYEYYDLILFTFSSEEISNATRSLQFEYLINEITFFGAGLGTPLDSGYVRDSTGFGFELTYINLLHKLGIFSLPLFITYIVTILFSLYNIKSKMFIFESVFALGSMGFMVPSIGNPMLLSPVSVLIHVIAIYVLIKAYNDYYKVNTKENNV